MKISLESYHKPDGLASSKYVLLDFCEAPKVRRGLQTRKKKTKSRIMYVWARRLTSPQEFARIPL